MSGVKKAIYIIIGILAMILGAIGAVIPVLPTTPFLLVSSFCFAKGSEKFDRWFKSTKIYKKYLESYVETRSMTMKKKIILLLSSDIMIAFSFISLESIYVKIILVVINIIKYYYFIFKINTIKYAKYKQSS